jgi:putative aldouronate transport system permease protein
MKYIFGGSYTGFWRAFLNSVIITVVVTIVSNLVEALAAYPLSKSDCPLRSGIMMYFIITMLFSAGIVPIYLLMRSFNLLNNIWSIILISISNVSNLLFYKTFFEGIPSDIEEAATLDGANSLQMFFFVVVPMSLPVLGSCCFFSIVGCWNGYGAALIFIDSQAVSQQPLAYFLYIKLAEGDVSSMWDEFLLNWSKNIEAAAMLVSIIPILCIYPYVIRYIKGGLTLGSVKG